MIVRNDLQGVERAPESITKYLTSKGGKNLYGEPNYRLIWSPNRLIQKGGKFSDWDKNIAVRERGGIVKLKNGLYVPNGHTPIRSVIEVRTVRKYAFDAGWVLERWVPAAYYGARTTWEERCVPGTDVQLSGAYPLHGDYEMCHNCASIEMPSISELQRAIERCERAKSEHSSHTEQILLERNNEAMAEYEAQTEKEAAETEAFCREIMRTNYSSSLQMGRHRSRVAESMGIREHVGA